MKEINYDEMGKMTHLALDRNEVVRMRIEQGFLGILKPNREQYKDFFEYLVLALDDKGVAFDVVHFNK